MRIVCNPGANLTARQIARYDIRMMPLMIKVDDKLHDLREHTPYSTVDEWVRTAKQFPDVLGTSAAEFIDMFRSIADTDPEIVVITGSRKIVGSYGSAASAARTFMAMPGHEKVRVEVIDSLSTDVSLGYCAVLAGESMRAGRTLDQTVATVRELASEGVFLFVPFTLERLVKGGRASFARAFVANLLNLSPMIGFKDGELAPVGKVSRKADLPAAIADAVVERLGTRRPVWVAVAHADAKQEATRLGDILRERLAVVHFEERPYGVSSYLNAGRVVGCCVHPVDRLGWTPPIPPRA